MTAAAVLADLEAVMRCVPKPAQIMHADRLRTLVERAALPTEAQLREALLSANTPVVDGDLRAQLSRLSQDLNALSGSASALSTSNKPVNDPVVAQPLLLTTLADDQVAPRTDHPITALALKEMVDGVSARLQANLLQSVPTTSNVPTALVVEVPIVRDQHCDYLQCEFSEEQPSAAAQAPSRSRVTLRLRLGADCEFTAQLRLTGTTLDVQLGTTDDEFNQLIRGHLRELEQQLGAHGVQVGPIRVASSALSSRPQIGNRRLVNERV